MKRVQDGNEFYSSEGDVWIKTKNKDGTRSYGKLFLYYPCRVCGKLVSNAGFANRKHLEMHRNNGEVDRYFNSK